MPEDSKGDLLLKRVQITIAILAGAATLVVGVYNVKKTVLVGGKGGVSLRLASGPGPVQGARVELQAVDGTLVHAGRTDAQGLYRHDGVEAGTYVLKAGADGFEFEARTVRIEPKRESEIEIALRPLAGAPAGAAPSASSPIRSAVEEVGASWIKKLGQPKTESTSEQK